MKRLTSIVILLCALLAPARAHIWPLDNESLYKKMLEYVNTNSKAFVGEPVYSSLQQFKVEVEAAHISDQYAWVGQSFRFCNMLETMYPPLLEHNKVMAEDKYERIRRTIVELKDYPLHVLTIPDTSAGEPTPSAAQKSAFDDSMKQAQDYRGFGVLEYLQNVPRPTDGSIQVIKLYSSGFIFRTANVCIGLDLMLVEGMISRNYGRAELTQHLDAVFTTHAHGDHYDIELLTSLANAGKPIVLSEDFIKNLKSDKKIVWTGDVLEPVQIIPGVKAQAGMASQGNTPCLLFLIDCDGWKIAATGDVSSITTRTFYQGQTVPDIIVAPIFVGIQHVDSQIHQGTNDEGITPVYFTAHENEWHHTLEGRIPFLNIYSNYFTHLKADAMYTVVMDQGEIVTLDK